MYFLKNKITLDKKSCWCEAGRADSNGSGARPVKWMTPVWHTRRIKERVLTVQDEIQPGLGYLFCVLLCLYVAVVHEGLLLLFCCLSLICHSILQVIQCLQVHYNLVKWKIDQNKVKLPGWRSQGLRDLAPLDLGQLDVGPQDSEHLHHYTWDHWTWNNQTTGL